MPLWGPSVTVARSDLAAVFCLHICQIHREICGLFNEKFMSDRAISPAVYTYWPHMWRQLLNCVFEKPASTGYSVFDTVVATQKRLATGNTVPYDFQSLKNCIWKDKTLSIDNSINARGYPRIQEKKINKRYKNKYLLTLCLSPLVAFRWAQLICPASRQAL